MPFCPNCGKEINKDTKFCPECGKPLTDTHSEQAATSALYKEVSERELGKRTTWFERHLNWTMVLAWVGSYVICVIGGLLLGLTNPYMSEEVLYGIGIIIGLIVILPVGYWVLKKKNRNMWWLLISGSLFFLLLQNRSFAQKRGM